MTRKRLRTLFPALAVLGLVSLTVRAEPIGELRAAYNEGVRRLSTAPLDTLRYPEISPSDADGRFQLGSVPLKNMEMLHQLPGLGSKITLAGNLIVSEPEELSSKAAPKRIRLYGAPAEDGTRAFVPLEISLLKPPALAVINRFCTAFPCPVKISGRVWEVVSERVRNLFSPTGAVTVMIGLAVEDIRFREAAP